MAKPRLHLLDWCKAAVLMKRDMSLCDKGKGSSQPTPNRANALFEGLWTQQLCAKREFHSCLCLVKWLTKSASSEDQQPYGFVCLWI